MQRALCAIRKDTSFRSHFHGVKHLAIGKLGVTNSLAISTGIL
jgi:hypothetical protein